MQLNGTYDVKLGKSFLDPNSAKYLTMRCDFMPASVDRTQPGSIKVDDSKEVVVNLPNVASVGSGSTVFRGSARPVQKECILIYNKKTGELTLERIAHAVQLKKTREEQKTTQSNAPASSCSTIDSQPDPSRQKKASARNQDNTKPPPVPLSKRKLKDARTSKSAVQSGKPRTLSSSSSCSNDGGGSGGGRANTSDGSEGRREAGAVASDTDVDTDSSSSSGLSDVPQSGNSQRAKQMAAGSRESSYLPVHRKLIEHDLKLSDSDSDD
ncbi:unnamed protein product [Dicrocoelium dendriticum]|nr:unnamed protein product [Dicrocoelium dendriticum]